MKHHISAAEATYAPQQYKTFDGALEAFLCTECPQIGGFLTRQALTRAISAMIRQFYPETSHLGQGQTPWVTVHKDAKGHYGKKITETKLTSVILDLVRPEDFKERAEGKRLSDMKKEAVARLCKQAYKQNGCLTNAELGVLLKMAPGTVSKCINQWELSHNEVLPRRGSIHDMGPTLTHKKIIIEQLFIAKKSVQQVSRDTCHSLMAIQRYIGTFRKVLICRQKGMTREEIAYAVGHTPRLIKQYEEIINLYENRGEILKELINCDIAVESQYDRNIKELTEGR